MSNNKESDYGFLVDILSSIFNNLRKISVFNFVKKRLGSSIENIKYLFVELWVVGNLIAAIFFSIVLYTYNNKVINYIILIYAALRVFEIIVYQINVVFFDPIRAQNNNETYYVKSIIRTLILIFINFLEIVFWYACMILSISNLNDIIINYPWIKYIGESFLCLATFNEGVITTGYSTLKKLSFLEIITGLVFTLISFARFLGLLPAINELSNMKPNSCEVKEESKDYDKNDEKQYDNEDDNIVSINISLNERQLERIMKMDKDINIKLEFTNKK